MTARLPENSVLEITRSSHNRLYWLRDPSSGKEYVFKSEIYANESDRLDRAGAFCMPNDVDNVYIPKRVEYTPQQLPAEISNHSREGGILMEMARGKSLSDILFMPTCKNIIPCISRKDWEKLEKAVSAWHEAGVVHGDLRAPGNLFVRHENGVTHFDIIDWGGPVLGTKVSDPDLLKQCEETLVREGTLEERHKGQRNELITQFERRCAEQNDGLVLDTRDMSAQEIATGDMHELPVALAQSVNKLSSPGDARKAQEPS